MPRRRAKAIAEANTACWALTLPQELWQRTLDWLYVDNLFVLAQVCKSFNSTFGDAGLVVDSSHPIPEGADASEGCPARALAADDADSSRQPKGAGGPCSDAGAGASGSHPASTPARDAHAAASHPHYSTPRFHRAVSPSSPVSTPGMVGSLATEADDSVAPTLFIIATSPPPGAPGAPAAHNRKRPMPGCDGRGAAGHFRSLAAAVAAAPPHAVLKLAPGIHWLGTQARPAPASRGTRLPPPPLFPVNPLPTPEPNPARGGPSPLASPTPTLLHAAHH